jgi:hypothetical protein
MALEILPGSAILLSMKKCDQQVCLKLAGTLRAAIRDDATARERSESWVIRRILIEHYAQRVVDRETRTAA